MINKKILIIGGVVILVCLIVGGLFLRKQVPTQSPLPPTLPVKPKKELKLSDFPEAFKDSTLIVVGDNASDIEMQAVNEIADYLQKKTENKPLIKKYSEITEKDKRNHNLIIVGTPKTNPFLEEVYALTNATRVTEEFLGEGKGVLEILPNSWNEEKAMLLVEGLEYKNPDQYSIGRGLDIMKQILLQEKKIRKIKVSKIYGPYNGWRMPPGRIGIPNPAALYCEKVGYYGSEKCNRWNFFSVLCDEEHTYCSKTGGILVTIKNWCRFAPVCSVCVLSSGKICYEFDYAMEACK